MSITHEEMVTAVVNAASEVFSTMLGMDLEAGKARVESTSPARIDGIVALVGLAGTWAGTGTVCCSTEFACQICSALLMMEAKTVDAEVLDAVGEVANMILGNFKTAMEEKLGPLGLSIPTVVFGHNFTTRSLATSEWVVVPFRREGETLEVKICLAPAEDGHQVRPAGQAALGV